MHNTVSNMRPLTEVELRDRCPAAFAERPSERASNRYLFVPTNELVTHFREEGYLPVTANATRGNPTAKHLVRLIHQDHIGQAVETVPTINIVNSHDCTTRFKLIIGIYRLVCSNGLMVGTDIGVIAVKHLLNNREAIKSALEVYCQRLGLVQEQVALMQNKQLTAAEIITFLQHATAIKHGKPYNEIALEDRNNTMLAVSEVRREADNRNTMWHLFNRTQENIMRPVGGYGLRRISAVGETVRVNQALWQKAVELSKAA